jgi:hypothetical protein
MGILTRGILGPMINTTGAVIGKIVNRQNVVTGLRKHIPKPETQDQAEQKYRFKLLRDFLLSFPDLVGSGFKKKKRHLVPSVAAFKYNYGHAFCKVPQVEGEELLDFRAQIKLNFPTLSYSIGPVYGPNCGTAVRNSDTTCTFSWLGYPQSKNNQFTDRAGYVIWNTLTGNAQYETNIASRSDLSFTVPITPEDMDAELHFYMHFNSFDTKAVGDSIYLGSTV